MSTDLLSFLGQFKEWLEAAPHSEPTYGEFYVSKVTVMFDGGVIGEFVNDDPSWFYKDLEGGA